MTFNVPSPALDAAGIFCAENCLTTIELQNDNDEFNENIIGKLNFGGTTFNLSATRNAIDTKRSFAISSDIPINPLAFINDALKLLGIDLSVFGIDKAKIFSITHFDFTYVAHSGWLKAEEVEEEPKFNDSFTLDIKTDIGFELNNKFGFKNASFRIEKFSSEYDFSFYGELFVFGEDIPFLCCYGDTFSIAASQCGKLTLKSLEDIGALTDESNIANNFLADFKPSGKIKLDLLNFAVSSDFTTIQDFNIAVLLDYKWTLCESLDISVSNILASFSYSPYQKIFGLSGTITFCGIHTQIAAAVSVAEKTEKINWFFRWRMFDDETINLTYDNIARFLHVVYTQQLNIVADHLTIGGMDIPLWHSFGIMWANVVVLGLLFVLAFKKKWVMQ